MEEKIGGKIEEEIKKTKKNIKITIAASLVAIVFIILASLFYFGMYPVVAVNKHIILMRDYKNGLEIAHKYYDKLNQSADYSNKLSEEKLYNMIKTGILSSLIDSVLIDNELYNKIGKDKYNTEVNNYVGKITSDIEVVNNLKDVFGVDFKLIKKYYIEDKARYQILKDIMFIKDKDGQKELDWIKKLRKNAKVRILLPGIKWDNKNGVVLENG